MGMENGGILAQGVGVAFQRRRGGWLSSLLAFACAKPLGATGGLLLLVAGLAAILAPLLAPADPFFTDTGRALTPPGRDFLLGSDFLGRDILSRIIFGARISFYVAVVSMALTQAIGGVLGGVSGYFGGTMDMVIQRAMDAMMAFPTLVLALAIMAALGTSLENVIIAITIVFTPRTGRVIRSAVLSIRENQYVEAARATGCSSGRILLWHIAPNCMAPAIVIGTANMGIAILTEGSLSFLGAGAPPPTPSWGAMLSGAAIEYAEVAPWLGLWPGIALTLTVFGFNLLGDGLRDVLDPRLRT